MFTGQVSTTGDALTVKVRVQVAVAPQLLVTLKVTVLLPPQADGAAPTLSLESTALQPPVKVAEASQLAYLVSMAACVWQAASVMLAGQFSVTGRALLTVNERVQVCVAWQLLVTVKVTETVPPQANGAPVLLFEKTALQPPLAVAVANHKAYLALISA
jgi:hypothetical protein